MLKDRGEQINSEDYKNEAQKIKEKYAYVCDDLVEKFKKYTYKPSRGAQPRKIDIGYERFLGPDLFFH